MKKLVVSMSALLFPCVGLTASMPLGSCADLQGRATVTDYVQISALLGKVTIQVDRAIGQAYCGVDADSSHRIGVACSGSINDGTVSQLVRLRVHRAYHGNQEQKAILEIESGRSSSINQMLPLVCMNRALELHVKDVSAAASAAASAAVSATGRQSDGLAFLLQIRRAKTEIVQTAGYSNAEEECHPACPKDYVCSTGGRGMPTCIRGPSLVDSDFTRPIGARCSYTPLTCPKDAPVLCQIGAVWGGGELGDGSYRAWCDRCSEGDKCFGERDTETPSPTIVVI